MPFRVCATQDNFHTEVMNLKKISDSKDLFLNTKLRGSAEQGKFRRIVYWILSLFPKVHIAQTAPLKVAREVSKFAIKHQKFLLENDRAVLMDVVGRLKIKCRKYVHGKEKKAIDEIIAKIRGLQTKETKSEKAPPPPLPISAKPENLLKNENQASLKNFPPEVLSHIFSYLTSKDYENCAQVKREWYAVMVEEAKRKEFFLIKSFIQLLIKGLIPHQNLRLSRKATENTPQELIDYLEKVLNDLNFSNVATLFQLKISLLGEKIKILAMLGNGKLFCKSLEAKAKSIELPWLFNDIFNTGTVNDPCYTHRKIARLIEKKQYEKVFEVAEIISTLQSAKPGVSFEKAILGHACYNLIEKEQYELAAKISEKFISRDTMLGLISEAFIEKGQYELAVKISEKIAPCKGKELEEISLKLIGKGQYELAVKISEKIISRGRELTAISLKLIGKGQYELVVKIAKKITRPEFLENISFNLLIKHQLKEATEVACMIHDEVIKSLVLSKIFSI
ncbi:F-box-like domain-containing protein [Parachlamydia sp. AcF125]|uniref:F-box-like domain-containing protein n=1 Tax=Parachlamydia sp. AcF125 TaxID=2795736 RepID=UPI001BCA1D95|nr:F-box-like domain-containing protein [Parachlamydia sp. AcF125]MBS4168418.1 hypothetical protein [Parachlamydia sp. AcF125]